MDFQLRFCVTEDEKIKAYRLRYDLYVKQQKIFADDADHERELLFDEYDKTAHILIAELDGEVIGTLRLNWGKDAPFSESILETYALHSFPSNVQEQDIVISTRFLINETYRGTLLSFQMLWKMYEFAAVHGIELIIGSCQPHLVNYYKKIGYRPYENIETRFTSGLLVCIVVVISDFDYFKKIDSPLMGALLKHEPNHQFLSEYLPYLESCNAVLTEDLKSDDNYFLQILESLGDVSRGLNSILSNQEDAVVLLAKSFTMTCPAGAGLIYKGHISRTLYILISGQLEIYNDGLLIATVDDPGALVGEVALFTNDARISDVKVGPNGAQVLALNDRNLKELINSHGSVAAKFLNYVATELCMKLKERAEWASKHK